MNGSIANILARIVALLPPWFGNAATPIRDATLTGASAAFNFIYQLYQYAALQTRILTSTGGFLDLTAYDFFGDGLLRYTGQTDASFRTAIISELFRKKNTRAALISILQQVTGNTPTVFVPYYLGDGCAYDTTTAYWSTIGKWGSRGTPYQSFVTIVRGYEQSDADIYAAIEAVRMAGTIIWVQILSPSVLTTEGGVDITTEGGLDIGI